MVIRKYISALMILPAVILLAADVQAQNIENRVNALEEYVETFQPTLIEFSEELQNNIQKYTKGLEQSLQNYSDQLQEQLNTQMKSMDKKMIVLDLNNPAFQSIESNAGNFLISVDRVEKLPTGEYRVYMNIGNYNYADYKGFRIKLLWGSKFYPGYSQKIEEWRDTLTGAEYTFEGYIRKGVWNQVEIDIKAADTASLAYVEMELAVMSVELKAN